MAFSHPVIGLRWAGALLTLLAAWGALASNDVGTLSQEQPDTHEEHSVEFKKTLHEALLKGARSPEIGEALFKSWLSNHAVDHGTEKIDGRDLGEALDGDEDDDSIANLDTTGYVAKMDAKDPLPDMKKRAMKMAANLLHLDQRGANLRSQNVLHASAVPSDFNAPKEIEIAKNTKIMRTVATPDTSDGEQQKQQIEKQRNDVENMLMQRYNGTNKANIIAKVAKVFKSFKWNTKKSQAEVDAETGEQKAIQEKAAADKLAEKKAKSEMKAAADAALREQIVAAKVAAAKQKASAEKAAADKKAEEIRIKLIEKSPEYKDAIASGINSTTPVHVPIEVVAAAGSDAARAQVTAAMEATKEKIQTLQKWAKGERDFAKINPAGEKAGKIAAAKAKTDVQGEKRAKLVAQHKAAFEKQDEEKRVKANELNTKVKAEADKRKAKEKAENDKSHAMAKAIADKKALLDMLKAKAKQEAAAKAKADKDQQDRIDAVKKTLLAQKAQAEADEKAKLKQPTTQIVHVTKPVKIVYATKAPPTKAPTKDPRSSDLSWGPMRNPEKSCWKSCHRKYGPCPDFCGSGMCCKNKKAINGCSGGQGGNIWASCVFGKSTSQYYREHPDDERHFKHVLGETRRRGIKGAVMTAASFHPAALVYNGVVRRRRRRRRSKARDDPKPGDPKPVTRRRRAFRI